VGWLSATGVSERHGMGMPQQRDGVDVRRPDGKAVAGWPPQWRRPAAGRRRGGCARGGRMHAAVGKANVDVCFLFFRETASRWSGGGLLGRIVGQA
jgi:ribosomal protein S14